MRHMHLPYFDVRIIRKYSNASVCESKNQEYGNFRRQYSILKITRLCPPSYGCIKFNFHSFLWIYANLIVKSAGKKALQRITPQKKKNNTDINLAVSAMTCNNNNNSSKYTKIAFRHKHLVLKNVVFHFVRIEFCP